MADTMHAKEECNVELNTTPVNKKSALKVVGLGQLLSLLLCVQAVCSGYLQKANFHMSTGQSLFCYVLLTVCYFPFICYRQGFNRIKTIFVSRAVKYAVLAIIDVEANYLMVKAYQYTTVTSVQLLDCLTIPNVVILTMIVFRVRYSCVHFIGVVFSLMGIGALTLSDYLVAKDSHEARNKMFGDALVLLATVLYALSNVGQEYAMKSVSKEEYLAFIGLFGTVFSACQLGILERAEITETDFHNLSIYLPLASFVVCLFLFYSAMPIAILTGGATSVNLNLLSADFYAILVGLFLFHYTFHYLYFVGFTCIIMGVVIYHIQTPKYKESNPATIVQTSYSDIDP